MRKNTFHAAHTVEHDSKYLFYVNEIRVLFQIQAGGGGLRETYSGPRIPMHCYNPPGHLHSFPLPQITE
jgi:hypothetical protein